MPTRLLSGVVGLTLVLGFGAAGLGRDVQRTVLDWRGPPAAEVEAEITEARGLCDRGAVEAGLDWLRALERRDPRPPTLYTAWADCHLARFRADSTVLDLRLARAHLTTALDLRYRYAAPIPAPALFARRAYVHAHLGDADAALRDIETARTLDPDRLQWQVEKAMVQQHLGQRAEAVATLQAALQSTGDPAQRRQVQRLLLSLAHPAAPVFTAP